MSLTINDEASSARPFWLKVLGRSGRDTYFLMSASLIGFAMRVAWAVHREISLPHMIHGEAQNSAIGLAINGFISTPYRPPDSIYPPDGVPTAHLLPIPIAITAGVYRLFGINTTAATLVLTVLAVSVILAGFVLLYHAFAALGLSRAARLGAFSALCLIPLNMRLEAEEFRYWEGGYGVMAAAALLVALVRLDGSAISTKAIWLLAFLSALSFFISPQLGMAGYVCLALFAWRNIPLRRWLLAIIIASVALAMFIVPWTLRNEALLGRLIMLRSNFGLELALGFYEGAVTGDERSQFEQRYLAIHPNMSDRAYALMKAAGGEDAYAEELGQQTKAWMRAHPLDTLVLGARHFCEYLFPPLWSSRIFYRVPIGARDYLWQALLWAYSFLGLVGCIYALARCNRRFQYAAILMLVSALPYVLVQPIDRYHYVMYALSVYFTFLALDAVAMRVPSLRSIRARMEQA